MYERLRLRAPSDPKLLPRQVDLALDSVTLRCDSIFHESIVTATSDVATLIDYLNRENTGALSSARTRADKQIEAASQATFETSPDHDKKLVLLLNVTRATPLGMLRANKIEETFGARCITVKLCSSLREVDRGTKKLVHISAEFKTTDGLKKIKNMLEIHKLPAPWAIIVDYLEPFAYGTG